MRKTLLLFLMVCMAATTAWPQQKVWNETPAQKTERLKWWTHDRFGMFIHWGIYALPARHEWVQTNERIPGEEYRKYFNYFNPDLYNPHIWARKAKEAGMKYAVITAKHHDGFCLFNSKHTDYNVMNTPYGKDAIGQWVKAYKEAGLKVGFYYSLIDWHHPHFTYDRLHPERPADKADFDKANADRDMNIYRQYMKDQITELLTNYGKIDILWLDFSYPGELGKGRDDWGAVELIQLARKLQPGILIDDRADLHDVEGGWDFVTPEQYKVDKWPELNGQRVPWETCQTFSGSWGYYRDEVTWKNKRQLLVLLIETVSKGGNLLLNVGPTARGEFDYRAVNALEEMGSWMHHHSRSVYGCTEAPAGFKTPANTLLTYNPKTNRLYIHLLDYPIQNFKLPGYKGKVKYAQFLHDASEIKITEPYGHHKMQDDGGDENDLNLSLPVLKPNVDIPVIEIMLEQ